MCQPAECKLKMGAFFAKFRRQPAGSDDAPRGPSRVTDQDKAVFVRKPVIMFRLLPHIHLSLFVVCGLFLMCRN